MMKKFLVATGIVCIDVQAENAAHAIEVLKRRIRARAHEHHNPIIGMSLVNALSEGRLNFIVMNAERTQILAGEYQGRFQPRPRRELGESLRAAVPEGLVKALPFDSAEPLRDVTLFGGAER